MFLCKDLCGLACRFVEPSWRGNSVIVSVVTPSEGLAPKQRSFRSRGVVLAVRGVSSPLLPRSLHSSGSVLGGYGKRFCSSFISMSVLDPLVRKEQPDRNFCNC